METARKIRTAGKDKRPTRKNLRKNRGMGRYVRIGAFGFFRGWGIGGVLGMLGMLGMGGLPACGIFRPERVKTESFRTEVCDSLREREKMEGGKRFSGESVGYETIRWQEVRFSPPDSAGRQYIRRVQTASTCAVGKTAVEDTVSVRSSRENSQVHRSSEKEARRQATRSPVGWRTVWIAGGGALLLLGLARRFKKS